jgi:hypothetical protein
MQHAGEEAISWVDDEAAKAGFEGDQGMERWLGSVVQHRGVEISGMCWFFHEYASKYIQG